MKNISKYLFLFVVATVATSCDDYLDIKPVGKVIPETLTDFRAVLTKGYATYPEHKSLSAVRADEVVLDPFSNDFTYLKDIYTWNDVNPDRITTDFPYESLYNTIFYANVIINEASKKLGESPERNQLIGEAYALRAMAYFDLVNLYGKSYDATTASTDKAVPLALEIDLEQAFIPETVATVYNQVISDKEQAKRLLNLDTQTTGINYRFSKAALYAFESRIYLYQKEWKKAAEAADLALTYKSALLDLNSNAILPNNYDGIESIMALEDVFNNAVKSAMYVSPELIDAYNKTDDLRFALYFQANGDSYKFNKGGELNQKCSFRTSELYLTKAETAAQLNDLSTAKTVVLDFIKTRYTTAGFTELSTTVSTMSQTQLLDFIYKEKQREFAAEGHRWFDLRRTTQQQIIHTLDDQTYTLIQNDPRYTLRYPAGARLNNPNL
jgi:hypothetical protein